MLERKAKKCAQILEGSRTVFLERGYEGASVDAIAAEAGVSKPTLYKHFGDKQGLFLATFAAPNEEVRRRFLGLLEEPSGNIKDDLHQIGAQLLRVISAPGQVERYRMAAGAAERFPEVAQALFDSSISVSRQRIEQFLERAAAANKLRIDDAVVAGGEFHGLCVGYIVHELVLGVRPPLTETDIAARVPQAVKSFLKIYGRSAGVQSAPAVQSTSSASNASARPPERTT